MEKEVEEEEQDNEYEDISLNGNGNKHEYRWDTLPGLATLLPCKDTVNKASNNKQGRASPANKDANSYFKPGSTYEIFQVYWSVMF